jgi:hypothetical protein
MLIEFGPGDASGTAGCDPASFVEHMYANGYSLWEWGYRVPLEVLVTNNIPAAINGEMPYRLSRQPVDILLERLTRPPPLPQHQSRAYIRLSQAPDGVSLRHGSSGMITSRPFRKLRRALDVVSSSLILAEHKVRFDRLFVTFRFGRRIGQKAVPIVQLQQLQQALRMMPQRAQCADSSSASTARGEQQL